MPFRRNASVTPTAPMTTRDLVPSSSSPGGGGRRRILVLADHLGRHLSDMLTYVIRRKAEVMVIFKPYAPMAAVTQDIDGLTRSFSRQDTVVVIAGTNDLQLNSSDQIVPLVESMLRSVLQRTRLIVATIPKRYDSTSYKKTISHTNKGIRSLRNRYPALKILELEDMGRAYHCSRGFSLNTKGKLKLCVKLSELVAVTPKTKFLNAPFDRIAMFLDPFEPAEEESEPLVTRKENCEIFPVNRVVVESDIKFMTPEDHDDQYGDDIRGIFGRVIGEVILRQGRDARDCYPPVDLNIVESKVNIENVSVVKRQNLAVSKAERLKCTSRIVNREYPTNDHPQARTQTKVHADDDKILQLVFTIRDSDLAFNASKIPAVIDISLDLKRILKFCDERNVDCTLVFSDVYMSYDNSKSEINISLKMSVAVLSHTFCYRNHLRLDLKPTNKFSGIEMECLAAGDQGNKSLSRGEKEDEDDRDFFDLSIINWNELLDIGDNESFSSVEINETFSTAEIIETCSHPEFNGSFPPADINESFSSSEINESVSAAEINEGSILNSHDGQRLDLQGLLEDSSRYYSRTHTDWNLLFNYDYVKSNHLLLPSLHTHDSVEYDIPKSMNAVFSPPKRKKAFNILNAESNRFCKTKKMGNFRTDGGRKQRCDRLSSRYSITSNLNTLCTRLFKCHHCWANSFNYKKFCSVSEEYNLNFFRKHSRYSNYSILGEVRRIRKLEGDCLRNRPLSKRYDLSLVKEAFCSGSFDNLWNRNYVAVAGPAYLRDVRSNQRLIDNTLWEMVRCISRFSRQYLSGVGRGILPNAMTTTTTKNIGGRESESIFYGPDRRSFEADCRSRGIIEDHQKEVTTTARNSRARNYIVRTVRKLLYKLIHLPWIIDSE